MSACSLLFLLAGLDALELLGLFLEGPEEVSLEFVNLLVEGLHSIIDERSRVLVLPELIIKVVGDHVFQFLEVGHTAW